MVAAQPLNVLSLVPIPTGLRAEIEAFDPQVHLVVAPGWFDGEIRETWPPYTGRSYLNAASLGTGTRAERDDLLAQADVILGGFPVPLDLVARSPRLRWFHQTPAGASNLRLCDLWGSDVIVTTSRGLGNTLPIAEYVLASFLHFARGFHFGGLDHRCGKFDRFAYRPVQLAGKTCLVVGAGGIGSEVARLAAGIGMRVVGTRRSPDAGPLGSFERIVAPERLPELLGDAAFVAICCQWTPDTERLVGPAFLAALPRGAVLVNVARGEILDEAALLQALEAGALRGVALDVYVGEFEHEPPAVLWDDPRVLITPHVSGGTDIGTTRPLELFRDNLAALCAGSPLRNVLDWSRGY